MQTPYTDVQLDALRELANIGSGTAGTALSSLLGRPVDISVPTAAALPLEEAVERAGPTDEPVVAAMLPIVGDMEATVLLLFPPTDAATLCALLGVDSESEEGVSALGEIGNILGASYMGALGQMVGLELEPCPPQTAHDMVGAIVASVLLMRGESDVALMLDSELVVEGESCAMSFMLLPEAGGVTDLLARLGL